MAALSRGTVVVLVACSALGARAGIAVSQLGTFAAKP
jgi:hypothetical protein